jgi:photosystem II stability/assembly factor-like uncharacterized protein
LSALILLLFLSVLSLAPPSAAQERDSPSSGAQEKEERDVVQKRSEWFYGQRAYPRRHVPSRARLKALKQLDEKTAAERVLRLKSGARPLPSWTSIGPEPVDTPYTDPVVSGRVTALAINPSNNNAVYLAGAQGGVWQTTNGGTTWIPLTDTQASLAVGSIVLDPSNASIIYVGTGEENFSGDSYYGAGILKSTDGGATWTHICGPFCGPVGQDGYYGGGARIGALAVHPTNGQILLAAVALLFKDGIYRSADGGNTWTQVLSGNPGTAVMFDPTNGNIAYAALGSSFSGGTESVYKSLNGGQTWVADNGTGSNILPLANAGRIVLAMAPSSTTTLYASLANVKDGSLLGFFKTTDGGTSWTALPSVSDYCTPQCNYDNVIAVQPTNANVVFAGGAFSTTLVRSLDGGSSWSTLQSAQNGGFLHADMHALAFTPDGSMLYLGNDGGAYSTTQITVTNPAFTALNSTLSITQFYPGLTIDPANPGFAIGGTQDNGTEIYSGTSTWEDVTCGDGAYTAIDTTTPTTVYAACQQIFVQKSTASGDHSSWNLAESGISTSDRVDFIPPLVMDPSNSSALYFGTYRVYQTTNGAGSWTAISPDLTNGSGFWAVVTTIAVAPTDSNTVYAGTGDSHLQVTTNASQGMSATWSDRSTGLPPRVITQIAVDPTVSTTAYITFSGFTGFNGDSLGHVFKTTDGGSTWTDISSDLPNAPVNSVVIVPDEPSVIFVGTDVGVFYTTNDGGSWTPLVDGLPRIAVLGMALHNPSRTLRASTHGRGVWDLNIASLLSAPTITSLVPSSVIAGGSSFPLTVNGQQFDSTAVVQWNGANLPTTFVNSGQLTATVPANDIATAGTASVGVLNVDMGTSSNLVTFTIDNPVPVAGSLSPNSALAGGAAFTLTVNGSSFVSASVVQWDGANLATTFVNSGQLMAMVPASDITVAGTANVTVTNPGPGGGTSNALTFTIDNPVPIETSLSPNSAIAGGKAFSLTVNGSSFLNTSTVKWNGSARTTTFVTSTQLKAAITAADISVAGTASVTVVNPGPGGGTSNALTFSINNPVPVAKTLSPKSAIAGGAGFTLTVSGTGFVSDAVVNWNASARTTTFVSSTQLKATINAADIALAGAAKVTVTNPGPGGGTSKALTFTIDNPVPVATSLSPSSATKGGPAFTLTVTGSNFVTTSTVKWKGSNRATTFVNNTTLKAAILKTDIANSGTAAVTVFNKAPGGGTSNALTFTINP